VKPTFLVSLTTGGTRLRPSAPAGAVGAAAPAHRGEARSDRAGQAARGCPRDHDPALRHADREPSGRDRRHPGAARTGAGDRQKAELLEVRNRLEEARDRLEGLRRELATAREVLAARLVEIYKADAPDVLTVVLEADGFGDLLERAEFLDRISDQDREITETVRRLRDRAHRQAVDLAALEERERALAVELLRQRDVIAAAETQLVSAREDLASARADKRGALAQVRNTRASLEGDLRALEAEQARVGAALVARQAAGRVGQGSGALAWPVSGPVVSPFGMRWGRLHAGVDVAVPGGTPIRAAGAGRVVLMGWVGGYGNYTCIQHTGSLSTCYAHQSSFSTLNGASVSQG
jgi:murein DD-endopeptidase MepM/ murein hydrolase activator NlpD